MSILDFIAVVSFGLPCFCAGYTFGRDHNKIQKQPPRPDKLSGDFCQIIYRTNRLSAVPFSIITLARIYRNVKFFRIYAKFFLFKHFSTKNLICLPMELWDVLSPDPSPYGRGDFMSTYEEFMVIIALASLIVSILNLTHKKQPSRSRQSLDGYFLQQVLIFAGPGDLHSPSGSLIKHIINPFHLFVKPLSHYCKENSCHFDNYFYSIISALMLLSGYPAPVPHSVHHGDNHRWEFLRYCSSSYLPGSVRLW